MHECIYCKKDYSTKGSLENHQKTTKFCLKLQNNIAEIELFKCSYCKENFTQKANLDRHYERCKIRLNKLQEENDHKKEELISTLKEENQKIKTEILLLKEQIRIKNEQHEKELKIKDNFIDILQSKINKDTKLYTVSYLKMANEESEEIM